MNSEIREYVAGDGYRLRCRRWATAASPDALVYLHGIESHSGWFAECAEKIMQMGIAVYALDRRGSGMNTVSPGYCRDYRQLVDDVLLCAQSIKSEHRRVHLASLSWGGKLAPAIDILRPGIFSTITLISPGIFSRVAPGIGEKLNIALNSLFRPLALHPIPIEDRMFTSLPKYLEYIANDPLRLRRVTARFYFQTAMLDRFLKKMEYQWAAPTQFLLAERDEIVDNRRVKEMFECLKAQPKRLKTYAGCNHSLQFERPDEVSRDIVDWIRTADAVGC
ncbi:alpha/beta fold hydrolase [Candidatus Poribacteria bacterium]|nr:alpha/beta fold hydrolase [Candidatus Poribacteria bacterium]